MRVAINGFGRIGKLFFLACMERDLKAEFVINDLAEPKEIVYALTYDTTHKLPKAQISASNGYLQYGNKKVKIYNVKDLESLPWKKEKIDLVVECTGLFTKRESAEKHLKAGAKRVLISAPAENQDATYVYGVNTLKQNAKIISAGSCTTNCVAPIVKILNDAYGIDTAHFVTCHAFTSTQKLIDAFDKKDARRGRAASENIVPSTSGASISVVEAVPEMKDKLEGYALRVPVRDGSISTVVAKLKRRVTAEQINTLFEKHALKQYKGIVEYSNDALVSSDIIHNPHSCIFDSGLTFVNGDHISVAGWYDNEWGYSNRLVDIAKEIAEIK
jgi:glyceraldehyde 3-phosphate dehydrogenase